MDVVRQYWLWRLRNAYLMADALRLRKFRAAKPDEISGARCGRKLIPSDREDFQDTAPLVFHTGTANFASSRTDDSEPHQQR